MARSSSKPKETNLPLIIALVFFILTTIGLGVFCYTQFAEIDTANAAKEAATKEVAAGRKKLLEMELEGRVQRVFFGIERADPSDPARDDLSVVLTDVKEGDAAFQHLQW